MLKAEKKFKLSDLIDIALLQKFQDAFAQTMDIACLTYDTQGTITEQSNFDNFCIKFVRSEAESLKKCNDVHLNEGKAAAKKNEAVIYTCPNGLTEFAVPLFVKGKHFGTMIAGQVFTSPPDEDYYRKRAKSLNIDEDAYIKVIKQVKIVPIEKIEKAQKLLSVIATSISRIAENNLNLIEQGKRQKIYGEIIETIRSSLEIGETKQTIVNIVGKTLKADRCLIIEYDKTKGEFLPVVDQYLSSERITSYRGININKELPNLSLAIKSGEKILVHNGKIAIDDGDPKFDVDRETIKRFNVHSAYAVPLYYFGELLGVLSLHYVNKDNNICDEDINLVKRISEQVAIAIYQSKLFKSMQKTVERETLLRNIVDKIRSSLDLDETLSYICTETAKLFNVQRSAIVRFPNSDNYEEFVIKREYLSDPSLKGMAYTPDSGMLGWYWANNLLEKNKVLAVENISEADVPSYFKDIYAKMKIKSIIGTAIKSGDNVWGTLSLADYKVYRHWSEEEKALLKTIADQVYIAIVQAEIFEKEKKTAEREALLRDITSAISSTLDLNQIKQTIVNKLGKILDSDFCGIYLQNQDTKKFLPVDEYSIYLASDEFENPIGLNIIEDFGWGDYFRSKEMLGIAYFDVDEFKKDYNLYGTVGEEFLDKYKIKSFMLIPIVYADNLLGMLGITFIKRSFNISEDDLKLARSVATQAGIAFHQAELFEKAKKNAQREKIIGSVLTKAISTFDINEIKQIVTEVGLITKADRCFFVEVDLEQKKGKPIAYDGEYLSSDDIKSIVGYEFPVEDVQLFVEKYLEVKDLIFFDYEKIIADNSKDYAGIKRYSQLFGLKSGIGIPFIYMDKLTAILAIEYVKEKVFPSADEFDFLRILAKQIGLAFSQIQLYQDTKMRAEKETTLRKTIDVLRGSLNSDEIKRRFIEITMNYFDADRCLFDDYDKETDKFLPFKIEKLKSRDIKSLAGIAVEEEFPEFLTRLRNGKDIIIKDLVKILQRKRLINYKSVETLRKGDTKSDYGLPVKYKNQFIGILIIHYVTKKRVLTQDELAFLRVLGDQVGIALYQAELYQNMKKTAEREILLKNIVEKIRGSLDIEETLLFICEKTAELLGAQRSTIIMFPDKVNNSNYIVRKEYKASPDVPGFSELSGVPEISDYWSRMLEEHDKIFVVEDIIRSDAPEFFKNSYSSIGVKSVIGTTIGEEKNVWGNLILSEYDTAKHWSDEDKTLLKTITNQIFIAINQAELYQNMRVTAEREKLLRTIIETVRSSLDITVVKKRITEVLGKAFKADRCYFRAYDKLKSLVLPAEIEYLSSPDIKSMLNLKSDPKSFDYFLSVIKNRKKGFYPIVVDDTVEQDEYLSAYMKAADLKADYAVPIIDRQEEIVWLLLHYVKEDPKLDEDSKKLLETIAYQIDIAFEQIGLYNTAQKVAEREILLRKIFETIRSSLDIDNIKKIIVTEVGKALDVDRCFVIEYDKTKNAFSEIGAEYLSSNDIIGYTGADPNNEIPNFSEAMKKGKSLLINNKQIFVDGYDADFTLEKEAIKKYDVYSAFALPLYYFNDFLGILAIHYVKEHEISKDEMSLMNMIANQVSIALYHAKLYNTLKQNTAYQTAILNNMPFMAWFKDKQNKLLAVNDEYARMCSTTVDNIIGKTDFDLFPKEQAESYVKEDLIVMETKQTISSVDLISGPDGATWHETFKSPVIDDNGNAVGTAGISRDITDSKEAHLELLRRQAQIMKARDREKLLRKIFEAMRSSLSLNVIKKTIVSELGSAFKADRCFIVEFDENNDTFIVEQTSEYLSSGDQKSVIGFDTNKNNFKWINNSLKQVKETHFSNLEEFLDANNLRNDPIAEHFYEFNIKSSYDTSIYYANNLLGYIVLQYTNNYVSLDDGDLDFLKTLANQAGVAIHQAELYVRTKKQVEREALLRTITEEIRSSLDIDQIKKSIVTEVGKIFKADRCMIRVWKDYDKSEVDLSKSAEYLIDNTIKSVAGIAPSKEFSNYLKQLFDGNQVLSIYDTQNLTEETLPINFLDVFGIKSAYVAPILGNSLPIGYLIIEFDKQKVKLNTEDMDLLITIASQSGIAITQAELYSQTKKQAEREAFLRKIIETVGGSLDLETVLNAICKEIFELFKPDRVAIENFPVEGDYQYWLLSAQTTSGPDILGVDVIEYSDESKKYFGERVLEQGIDIVADDIERADLPDYFVETHRKLHTKSFVGVALKKGHDKWGVLALSQVHHYRKWTQDELQLLYTVADQAHIAIRQAELFTKTKIQAEREKISRNIVEILRSTMDKNVIKHLFVKNIGKYFNADRVFFSEYDSNKKIYLPVDKQSEYLSNPDEKSFVGYDWTDDTVREYMQPLLEKRELKIFSWDEYIKENHRGGDFISLFVDADVKSSYNFPVLYQERIMGYFCIEFTHEVHKFSEEDINRIRVICTQTGIALYQAELYIKAQESDKTKSDFIANISNMLVEPLNNMVKFSEILPTSELDHEKQQEYLHNISQGGKQLLGLTRELEKLSKTSPFQDKP